MTASDTLMTYATKPNAIFDQIKHVNADNTHLNRFGFERREEGEDCEVLLDFAAKTGCCEGFKAEILSAAKEGRKITEKQAWVLAFAIAPAINEVNIAKFISTTTSAAGSFDDLPLTVDENTPFHVVKRFFEAQKLGLR